MRLHVVAFTDIGAVRERNEDSVGVAGWLAAGVNRAMLDATVVSATAMVAVADGMGGHPTGDVASRLTISHLLANSDRMISGEDVGAVVREANLALYAHAGANPDTVGMGSTVAGITFTDECAYIFNVGDSLVARVIDGYLGTLSVDDRSPRMPGQPEDMPTLSLSQCLGGTRTITEVDPHVLALPVGAGDCFLICTDGVTDAVNLAQLITRSDLNRPAVAVEALRDQVLRANAPDNLSAILVRVLGAEE